MQLADLLSVIPFYKTNHRIDKEIKIESIEMDHREITKGALFICIKGFTVDGHSFAAQAAEKGASVIVSEKELPELTDTIVIVVQDTKKALALIAAKFYQNPTLHLPLIGVTGTNGKTTITYLLEKIYQMNNQQTGLIGTIQTKIKDKTLPVRNTTPDALQLSRIFSQMVSEGVDIAMMEVSSHALDMGRVHGCDFDIAIFTNLTQDHLDYHKDMDDYLRAKTLLFTGLGNSYGDKDKYAVLNADDSHSDQIAKAAAQPVVTYGLSENADIRAENISYRTNGMTFTLVTPQESIEIDSHLIGKFNIYNMLAAASAAILRNVSLKTIQKAFEEISGVDGRFQQVNLGQNYTVIVDYAHTPDSLENVLETIEEFKQAKVYVVVGTGGDRDKTKRPLMAKVALDYADKAIFTSDNPRTEDPALILGDMIRDIQGSNYEVIENRKEAIHHAIGMAEANDVILIAGKGHETYQEINGVRHDFDDRKVAKEAIQKKEQ